MVERDAVALRQSVALGHFWNFELRHRAGGAKVPKWNFGNFRKVPKVPKGNFGNFAPQKKFFGRKFPNGTFGTFRRRKIFFGRKFQKFHLGTFGTLGTFQSAKSSQSSFLELLAKMERRHEILTRKCPVSPPPFCPKKWSTCLLFTKIVY